MDPLKLLSLLASLRQQRGSTMATKNPALGGLTSQMIAPNQLSPDQMSQFDPRSSLLTASSNPLLAGGLLTSMFPGSIPHAAGTGMAGLGLLASLLGK